MCTTMPNGCRAHGVAAQLVATAWTKDRPDAGVCECCGAPTPDGWMQCRLCAEHAPAPCMGGCGRDTPNDDYLCTACWIKVLDRTLEVAA